MLGHGGIVVFDDTVDLARQARFAMEFCADRELRQVHALPYRLDARRGSDRPDYRESGPHARICEVLDDLCELMTDGSLCALGGLIPYPVQSAVRHFPEDFDKPARFADAAQPAEIEARRHTHGANSRNRLRHSGTSRRNAASRWRSTASRSRYQRARR